MALIALIDDDATEALILQSFLDLDPRGHELVHCESFDAFEALLDNRNPDLVLLDRRLPPIESFNDGLDRIDPTGWTGPIVLLTASTIGIETPHPRRFKILGPIEKIELLSDAKVHNVIDRALAL